MGASMETNCVEYRRFPNTMERIKIHMVGINKLDCEAL
jgi:hypothetical protein